jgi:hypothetical protein
MTSDTSTPRSSPKRACATRRGWRSWARQPGDDGQVYPRDTDIMGGGSGHRRALRDLGGCSRGCHWGRLGAWHARIPVPLDQGIEGSNPSSPANSLSTAPVCGPLPGQLEGDDEDGRDRGDGRRGEQHGYPASGYRTLPEPIGDAGGAAEDDEAEEVPAGFAEDEPAISQDDEHDPVDERLARRAQVGWGSLGWMSCC